MYEEIQEWLEIYHSSSSVKEKEKVKTLIVSYMYPVIKHIAKTIARRATDPIEDMIQAGFIGLLKAIDKYNTEINNNFKVYAGYLIIGEMKHFLRDKLTTIRVPAHIQELSIRIYNFTKNLTYEEVQTLTSDEIASVLEVPTKAVDLAFMAERRRSIYSLEEVFQINNGSLNYEEILTEKDFAEKLDYKDAQIIFQDSIDKLPPEEKVLVDLYYNQDLNKSQIAEALQMTPMSVNRGLKRAFSILADIVAEKKFLINEDDF